LHIFALKIVNLKGMIFMKIKEIAIILWMHFFTTIKYKRRKKGKEKE